MAVGLLKRTAREIALDRARRYYWGRQYDHLHPWNDPKRAADLQLREKRPSVRIKLSRLAYDTVNDYLFGEGRRPTFGVPDSPDESAEIERLLTSSGLHRCIGEVGRLGLVQGAVAVAFHVHDGAFDVEFPDVDLSEVTLGRHDKPRARSLGLGFDDVLIYEEYWRSTEEDPWGSVVAEYLHRRTWDTERVIEYEPIETAGIIEMMRAQNWRLLSELPWTEDEERTVEPHNLGFCPVEWIPNGKVNGDIWGRPLLDDADFDTEDEVNYTLSQAGRGVSYNQDPWLIFKNVKGAGGGGELTKGGGSSLALEPLPASNLPADAQLLELQGTGQQIAMDFADRLRALFYESNQIVIHDPDKFAGALSGVALKRLLQPMLNKVQGLRPHYGGHLGRLAAKMRLAELGATGRSLADYQVTATWPDVVQPTAEDRQMDINAAGDAFDRDLIERRTAIRTVAQHFGITDAEQYAEEMLAGEVLEGTARPADGPPDEGDE